MSQSIATSVDIIPFTTINHEAQKMLGISNDEYCVANAIHNLSHNPKSSIPGWCYAKKEYLSAAVNVSRASVFRYIHKLVSLGLVELHPDRKELMRTTAKWYDSTLIKKVEIVVEDMPIVKPQSQNETTVSDSINTDSLNLRQESHDERIQSQIEIDESQNETAIYKDLQGNVDKEKDKETNTTNVVQADAMEGEVVNTLPGKVTAKKSSSRSKQNPDGSWGDSEINEVQAYFLEKMDLPTEDGCTRDQSRQYWRNLLAAVKEGHDRVSGVKKLIDIAAQDVELRPNITSSKDLYYKRVKLATRFRAGQSGGRGVQRSAQPKATYGNIVGGVAW